MQRVQEEALTVYLFLIFISKMRLVVVRMCRILKTIVREYLLEIRRGQYQRTKNKTAGILNKKIIWDIDND